MIAFKGRCHKDLMHIAPDVESCSQRLIVNDKLEILRNLSARILLCKKHNRQRFIFSSLFNLLCLCLYEP